MLHSRSNKLPQVSVRGTGRCQASQTPSTAAGEPEGVRPGPWPFPGHSLAPPLGSGWRKWLPSAPRHNAQPPLSVRRLQKQFPGKQLFRICSQFPKANLKIMKNKVLKVSLIQEPEFLRLYLRALISFFLKTQL